MSDRCDEDLHDLFRSVIELGIVLVQQTRGTRIPDGDAGIIWRWAFFYLVLACDLGDSALSLADGCHNRALLILRRAVFEQMTKLKFYRKRPEIAHAHLDDFTPRARLFQQRLTDGTFQIVPDPAFDEERHDPQKRYRRFELVIAEVFPETFEDLYANFYQYPSSLIHGDALATIDILELCADGEMTIHMASRRAETNQIVYNYVAFFISLLEDASEVLCIGQVGVKDLRLRLNSERRRLGIELK